MSAISNVQRVELTAREYHALDRLNASALVEIATSPAKFGWEREQRLAGGGQEEPTAALRLGTWAHTLLLDKSPLSPLVAPCQLDTAKAYKELAAANPGALVLTEKEYELGKAMVCAVHRHPKVAALLACEHEVSLLFDMQEYPDQPVLPMKARLDGLGPGWLVDYKTAADASPEGMAKAVAGWKYHLKMALYHDVAKAFQGGEPVRVVVIAQEKEPPYLVGTYALGADWLDRGRQAYRDALLTYRLAGVHGWPTSYNQDVEDLGVPRWL
jgi:hypothetical protein